MRMEMRNARRGYTDTRNAAVGINPAALLARLPADLVKDAAEAEPRQSDYVFREPMQLEVRYRLVPPPGYVPQPLPADRVRRFGTVSLSESYAAGADDVVTASFRLDTGQRRISAAELAAVRKGVREALLEKTTLLQFDQVGEAHLAAGRVREALQEFERLAAYRKARELDPGDEVARADLAILLEHDAKGRRYSPEADLAGAIAEYRALRRDLNDHSMDESLLVTLVRTGRFDEARKLAAELKDSQPGAVLALVALAATEGPEAAVQESERKFADEKARAAALQQAGQNLLLVRRYADAAVLFDRASRQTANPAALLSLADLVRRTRRHEDLQLPPDQPATVFKRFLLAMFTGDLEARKFSAFFSRDVQAELAKEKGAEETIRRAFSRLRDHLKGDMPADTAVDLGLAALRDAVTGDDALGYRVDFTSSLGETSQQFVVYVVRDGSEFRLAATSQASQLLASEILRRLDRGDLKGARQWLDWAAEGAHGAERAGGDPLPNAPFPALWAKGAPAGADELNEMRCAAAALLGQESASEPAVRLLAACRTAAIEPARRNLLDLALALADANLGRYDDLEKVSRRLVEAAPGSQRAEDLHVRALLQLGRWDEVRAAAERRLQRAPDDEWALHLLAEAALHAQDFDGAEQRFTRLVDSGKATARDFNELAWLRLELGRTDDKTVEYGQRAATLSSYGNSSHLHTLASVYAEMGKTAEAYRLILQSLAARNDEAPGADDWYVFGRLAEHYGLPDVARDYYKRVSPAASREEEAMSTHALVARRLATLGDTLKTAKTAKRGK